MQEISKSKSKGHKFDLALHFFTEGYAGIALLSGMEDALSALTAPNILFMKDNCTFSVLTWS